MILLMIRFMEVVTFQILLQRQVIRLQLASASSSMKNNRSCIKLRLGWKRSMKVGLGYPLLSAAVMHGDCIASQNWAARFLRLCNSR